MWHTMKRPKLQIVGIDEGEEFLVSGKDQIYNKIIGKKFLKLRKHIPINMQETHRTLNTQHRKRKFPQSIIGKTLSIPNKEQVLKAARERNTDRIFF